MDIDDLQAEFNRWAQRSDLMVTHHLLARAEALDFLTFLQDALEMQEALTPQAATLRTDTQALAATLATANQAIFDWARRAIQTGTLRGTRLRSYLNQFVGTDNATADGVYTSYDGLDVLIDGIFALGAGPAPVRARVAEMVHCEETPARVILDLIDHVGWQPADCFYDLGSGLGQVVMLVQLLTGMAARGVEYDPAFVDFARRQAAILDLPAVRFVNADARIADYSDGTIFFLFTPFRGAMLRTVMTRLRDIAHDHPIRVGTFGPCTPWVAESSWLRPYYGDARHEYQLVLFESLV